MTSYPIPDTALAHHTAVLGKTGAGKTSTAKTIVEHLVASSARVCILDPIKSDWWGLTSSADGRRPGLLFHILGGPRGHVPLHPSSGKAVAELVASGALPLSILDMADFAPGGQAKFFIDFAPALLRQMKGVVHLVMEEAHIFAPKERSGMGDENMAIHWAKMLATAGRSKGIRLILATQRTQSLHNAMLGSCETMVAHRLTAPADQKPLVDWLKANTAKSIVEQVSGSLSSLKTGTAWVCSGEDKFFERVQFPRITTYDNSATPTGEIGTQEVCTAPVDVDRLRSIVGDAAREAEANDPKALKAEIARLTAQIKSGGAEITEAEKEAYQRVGHREGYEEGHRIGFARAVIAARDAINAINPGLAAPPTMPSPGVTALSPVVQVQAPPPPVSTASATPRPTTGRVSPSARKILDVIHNAYPASLSFAAAAMRAGISKRSSAYRGFRNEVCSSVEVVEASDRLRSAAGFENPVRISGDPVDGWANRLPPSCAAMLRAIASHKTAIDKATVARLAGVSPTSSGLGSGLRELIDLELIEQTPNGYRLSEALRT